MCDEAEEEEEMMIGPFIQKHEKERERKGRERERESLRSLVCGESRAWRGSRLLFYILPLFFYNPSAPPRGNYVKVHTGKRCMYVCVGFFYVFYLGKRRLWRLLWLEREVK